MGVERNLDQVDLLGRFVGPKTDDMVVTLRTHSLRIVSGFSDGIEQFVVEVTRSKFLATDRAAQEIIHVKVYNPAKRR